MEQEIIKKNYMEQEITKKYYEQVLIPYLSTKYTQIASIIIWLTSSIGISIFITNLCGCGEDILFVKVILCTLITCLIMFIIWGIFGIMFNFGEHSNTKLGSIYSYSDFYTNLFLFIFGKRSSHKDLWFMRYNSYYAIMPIDNRLYVEYKISEHFIIHQKSNIFDTISSIKYKEKVKNLHKL